MACLLAPATALIITTSLKKKIPQEYHIEWLNTMLFGGVVMLIVEHIAHGEIVLFPPFLTAMKNPNDTHMMLKEIATIGTAMAIAIFSVWIVMILISSIITKKRNVNLTT